MLLVIFGDPNFLKENALKLKLICTNIEKIGSNGFQRLTTKTNENWTLQKLLTIQCYLGNCSDSLDV